MKLNQTIALLIVSVSMLGCTESTDKRITVSYFNQTFPSDTAVVFAPGVVSTAQHEHSRIEFSKDGTQMYWAVIPINPKYETEGGAPFLGDQQNIWYSKIDNNEWANPTIFQFTKMSSGSSPAFSSDGSFFYYRTPKLDADPDIRPKPSQMWKVEFNNSEWGKPVKENNLISDVERKIYMSFCFVENRNLYFDYGGPDSTGKWWWDIYYSKFNGNGYLAPVKMGNGINDGEVDWCPWVAPDESYLIFSSHREDGFGSGDLMISYKVDDEWTEPMNMGPCVNTSTQERFPSVSPDGKYLFFARHMPETFSDIFWIDSKIIEELRLKE